MTLHSPPRRTCRPEALFLDFYGTLTAFSRAAVETICERVIADHALGQTPADMALRWGRFFFRQIELANHDHFKTLYECERDSFLEMMNELECRLSIAGRRGADLYVQSLHEYMRHPPLCEDTYEVLRELDVPICLVTNADRDDVMEAIRHYGLSFDEVVTSQDARCYKPAAGIFEMALERTGWSREGVVHAGDSRHSDIEGARRVGLTTVLIDRTCRISDVGQAEPDYTYPDLRGLLSLFGR